MTTTLPAVRSASIASRFASRVSACCSGPSLRAVPEQNDRRRALATGCEERAEIGVGGHHHALLFLSANKNLFVVCRLQVVVADVRGIVPGLIQLLGEHRRKGVVDQKPHPEAASGNSRSRTASAA